MIFNFSFIIFTLFITIIMNLILGLLVYFKNTKSYTNIIFILLTLSIFIWSSGHMFFEINNYNLAYKGISIAYFIVPFVTSFVLLFVLSFDNSKFIKKFFLYIILGVIIPAMIISFLVIKLPLVNEYVLNEYKIKELKFSSLIGILLFSLQIITYIIITLVILFYKYIKSIGIEKNQLKFIFIGIFISGILGITTGLVLPLIGSFKYFGLTPVFTLFMIISMSYAILKHKLFNIKIIAVELLTFSVWIVMFIEVFLADSFNERLFEIGVLIFVIFFGILIIRSVLREVRTREKIENLANELESANKKLKEIDDQKTEFMSIASHQLRTPITSIKGYASMIKSGDFGKISNEQKEPLDIIFTSTENMNNLIDDFLNASRIERKRGFDYNFVIDNPINLIKGVIDNLKIQVNIKKVKFIFENKIDKYIKIKFDNRTLLQAISNLIQNAIKYTEKGEIYVKLSRINSHLEILVKDTGIGMNKEDLKMIFTRFYRSENVKKNHPEGTGLGLYLAEKIIFDHGGKILVESNGIGKGSKFSILIPIVKD